MSQRYLVTGAQGFVGRHVVDEALASGNVVMGIGRSPRAAAPPLRSLEWKRHTYEAVDVCEPAATASAIRRFAPTAIVHLASGLRDDAASDLLAVNVRGTLSLLDAVVLAEVPAPRIVIGSSGGVYGRATQLPLREDGPCDPVDMYSVSKLAQEHVARVAGGARGIDVVVARLFNLIGPGQDERHACARFARQLVTAASGGLGRIEVGDLTPTRDFIDVRDVASALLLLARDGRAGDVYNVGSGTETSISELLELTRTAAGLPDSPELAHTYHRAADIPRHVADIGKLQSLGYHARFDLAASVAGLVAHYRDAASSSSEVR